MSDDRTTALELRVTEQDRSIEELSAQLAEQWKVIDRMRAKLDSLTERFLTLEEQSAPGQEITKPPHW